MRRIIIASIILAALVIAGVLGGVKEPVQPSISCVIPETEEERFINDAINDAVEIDDSCSRLVPGQGFYSPGSGQLH